MKHIIKILFSTVLFVALLLNITNVIAQNCVCAICGVSCSVIAQSGHATTCKYYVAPTTSGSSNSSSSGPSIYDNLGNYGSIVISNYFKNKAANDKKALEAKGKADELAAKNAAIKAAEDKRLKDAKDQADYLKMMESYKTLNGSQNMNVKTLSNTDVKFKALDEPTDAMKEQEKMETNTQTWVEYQKEQFKIRLEQPNYWCQHYYENLEKNDTAKMPLPYKKFNELQPGDVLLFAPKSGDLGGAVVADVSNFGQESQESNASHTVTYLKVVNGKKIFLDNQLGEGPQIISEDQLIKKYEGHDAQVAKLSQFGIAQPLNPKEAQMLYEKALELAKKNLESEKLGKNNYGFGKGNLVCSSASWTLITSTGRELPLSKSWVSTATGVNFSPADFYAYKQYFLITPLDMSK